MNASTSARATLFSLLVPLALLAACAPGGGVAASRGNSDFDMEGAPISFAPPPTTVAMALDHAADLGITDAQRTVMLDIRRGLDSADAPLRSRLDSLRPTSRPVNFRDLSPQQREEIRAPRAAVSAVKAALRQHDLAIRSRVLGALSAEQQTKLTALEESARRRSEAESVDYRSADDLRRGRGTHGRGA